jgi:hypothetical protein
MMNQGKDNVFAHVFLVRRTLTSSKQCSSGVTQPHTNELCSSSI